MFKYSDAGAHHFKVGSLQEFVRHDDVVSDLAPSQFTLHEVHKIVLLDMRLLNTDRNDANILVRKRRSATTGQVEYELIPIDHGYCLPQFLEIAWCDWCWYNWPQLKQPLSAADREYVLGLSAQLESEALAKKIPLRKACRRNMVIAGMVVQKGVRAHLVLYDIARIMCRDDLDAPSTLERLCLDAFHQVQAQRRASEFAVSTHSTNSTLSITPPLSATAAASAAASPVNGKAPVRISIDVAAAPRASFSSNGLSPANSGARSPPGFWASFAPFSAFDDDDSDDDDEEDASNAPAAMSWDAMASQALSSAAKSLDTPQSSGSSSQHASPVPSSFSAEPEKDEFETLNDALDANAQDEKLFLALLSRLIDDQVEKCRRAAAASSSSSSRSHGPSSRR